MPQIKHTAIFYIILALLVPTTASARVFYWPPACTDGRLLVSNLSNTPENVWLQKFTENDLEESEYELNPQQKIEIQIQQNSRRERYSLLQFSDKIKTHYYCGQTQYDVTEEDSGTVRFNQQSTHSKIMIQNIYDGKNTFRIRTYDSKNKLINQTEETLEVHEYRTLLPPTEKWQSLEIEAEHKGTSYLFTENGLQKPAHVKVRTLAAETGVAYFLVSDRAHADDSYVVPIHNPALILKARELIKSSTNEKIIFAEIQKDHSEFNRNFKHPIKSPWSWSVRQVTSFGDIGSTACNGHPQAVEDRVDAWVSRIGRICFWNYRLKRELSADEIKTGVLTP